MHVSSIENTDCAMSDLSHDENNIIVEGESKKPYNFSVIPYNIEQHLEYIDISDDGHLLLSSSNLVVRNWTGSVWLFENCNVIPDKGESICGHGCESPVASAKFIDQWEKVIIGEDSGKLTILTVSTYDDNSSHFLPNISATHHDDSISSLCLINGNSNTVSAGNDLRINIWDNNSLELEQKYIPAHSEDISKVISHGDKESKLFASCSLDGSALLWDPRQSKPASEIYHSEFGLTSMSWRDSNTIAVGTLAGQVKIADIRTEGELQSLTFHNYPVHHITSSPSGLLAACGSTNLIKVWDTTSHELVYMSDEHEGLVRCLVWHPVNGQLYSCGFDRKIYSHIIPSQADIIDS